MSRLLAVLTLSVFATTARADTPRAQVSGDRIVLNDKVHFEHDSEGIQRQSTPVLKDLARLMSNQSSIELIEIRGHTDQSGPMAYNQELSTRRADEVARFLVDNGVSADRIRIRGYGESRPLIDANNPRADSMNRRVEFVIVKKS